jgi:hypothetical protein
VQITSTNYTVITKITTLDFSKEGASLLAPDEKAQEDLLLAFPEMLVACMFGQKIAGQNNFLVLFEGITKFNDVRDYLHVARIWKQVSDASNDDKNKNVCIALLKRLKTGDYKRDHLAGKKIF